MGAIKTCPIVAKLAAGYVFYYYAKPKKQKRSQIMIVPE